MWHGSWWLVVTQCACSCAHRATNRAIADLSLEYVTGDLRDPASLDRAMKGRQARFSRRRGLPVVGQAQARHIRFQRRREQKIFWTAAKRAGVEQLIYTSTVATIARRSAASIPNEFTGAKLEEMVGHYKRSKWMAEMEALRRREKWIAGHCGHADDAGRTVGLEARRRPEESFWIF